VKRGGLEVSVSQMISCRVSEEELRAIAAEKQLARKMSSVDPQAARALRPGG